MTVEEITKNNHLITLENENIRLVLTDLGASILNLFIKDKEGRKRDVLVGNDKIDAMQEDYENNFGSIIGRHAGIIRDAKFTIDGITYELEQNLGTNNYDSGYSLWNKRTFGIEKYDDNSCTMSIVCQDLDQGFPGVFELDVTFTILDKGIEIEYDAVCSKKSPYNVTHKLCFNLNGEGNGDILKHEIKIYGEEYVPEILQREPFGITSTVDKTPINFQSFNTIEQALKDDIVNNPYIDGNPTYFVADDAFNDIHKQMEVIGDKTGIKLTVYSDFPCVQLDSCLNLSVAGKNNHRYNKFAGLVLSPQFFPNDINTPVFQPDIMEENVHKIKTVRYLFDIE